MEITICPAFFFSSMLCKIFRCLCILPSHEYWGMGYSGFLCKKKITGFGFIYVEDAKGDRISKH